MPKITFQSAFDGTSYVVLKEDVDLTKFQASALVAWEFDSREEDTLSLIRAEDGIMDFQLRRDENGLFNQNTYRIAYTISYARAHVTAFRRSDVLTEAPTEKQIGELPLVILQGYLRRTRTGLIWEKVMKEDEEKKDEPANPD